MIGRFDMDEMDRRLIHLLQVNARTPTTELAKKLGVSRTTVNARMGRLERSGAIGGYSVKLSTEAERGAVRAHVLVTCAPRFAKQVEVALRPIREVRTILSVSGPFDLIVMLTAPSISEMDRLLDAIGTLDGVERTTSSIILSTRLDRS